MCGLTGFFNLDRLPDDAGRLGRRMLDQLLHRGPDGSSVLIDERARGVFGYARLAINGLSGTGMQPMRTADQDITMVVNGEIYGFKRLRASLATTGERFASRSDCEVLLGLYRRHGLDFCDHIRGEFAVVIYDRTADRVVLTRDRFGVRPLYYYLDEEQLVWGSEIKALLVHPAVPRRLSVPAAINQLAQVVVPGSSAFERIRAVLPGCQLVVERSSGRLRASERRYWDLTFQPADPEAVDEPEAHIEEVRRQVIDAVLARTESDAPLGVYLSGGLDSAITLGIATLALQQSLPAATLSFSHDDYDEVSTAAEVAGYYGAPLSVRLIEPADLYGTSFVQAVWHSERTFYNTLGVAKMHLSRHARQHGMRAVLTGEGADELFAGYPAFALDGDATTMPEYDARVASVLEGSVVARQRIGHAELDRLWGFTPAWIQPWVATWHRVRPLLRAGLLDEQGGYDPITAVAHGIDASRVPVQCRLSAAQYTWIKIMLEGQILHWGGDRVDMANAIESRPVFLDHHLAEAAAKIPAALRIREGIEKWILRRAMNGILPPFMRAKRKFPLLAPPAFKSAASITQRDLLVEQYLSKQHIERMGICDPRRVGEFLTASRSASSPAIQNEDDKIINHLLGLHILGDLFLHGGATSPVTHQ